MFFCEASGVLASQHIVPYRRSSRFADPLLYLQVFRNIRKVRWLQAWPCEIEATKAIARDTGHRAIPAVGDPAEVGRIGDRREAGQIGTVEERAGDVSARLVSASSSASSSFRRMCAVVNFIQTVVAFAQVWPFFGHQSEGANEVSAQGTAKRIEL